MPETQYVLKVLGQHWKDNASILCVIYEDRRMITLRRHLDRLLQPNPAPMAEPLPAEMNLAQIQTLMYFLFVAVQKCHSSGVMHRGLCPDHLLISLRPIRVCLADFRSGKSLPVLYGLLDDGNGNGNGKEEEDAGNFTPPSQIFGSSFNYTAPELLMGATTYTQAVDIWSMGAIFAEMLNGAPLFERVRSERRQLRVIFRVLGLPSNNERMLIPGVDEFQWSDFQNLQMIPTIPLADAVPRLVPAGLDLVRQMLDWVPQNRITAQAALSHPYFHGMDYMDDDR